MNRALLSCLIGSLVSASCLSFAAEPSKTPSEEVYFTETFALGTLVTGQFKAKSPQAAEACFKVLNDETRRIENLLSSFMDDSDVSLLAKNPGEWTGISKDTYEVLQKSKEFSDLTQGAFEPTLGTLIKLWSVDQNEARVPSDEEIKKALSAVSYKRIELKKEGANFFAKIGADQQIGLGAIGKGFIADKVIAKLKASGCSDSLVSLGGNLIGSGRKPDGSVWSVGLQSPDKERGEYFAVVPLKDTSVVTSGDYEKFFIKDGVKYQHILNPKTGRPVTATLSSVTIIDDSSTKADALCTALFVMGWDGAQDFLRKHPALKAVLVDEALERVLITQSAKDLVRVVDPKLAVGYLTKKGAPEFKRSSPS